MSDVDEPMFEGEGVVYDEQLLSPPPYTRSLPQTGSNKRRAPGGPMASQPNIKSRSRRGDEQKGYNTEGGPPGMRRGPGPEGRREELVDVELAKYLRRGTFYAGPLNQHGEMLTSPLGSNRGPV